MPYRVDLTRGDDEAFDRLIELGAMDADRLPDGRLAAVMPDRVNPDEIARALDLETVAVSRASGRDAGSVWVLALRPVRVGRLRIVPSEIPAEPGDLRLVDAGAFGTGLHPTTRLCLDALEDLIDAARPQTMLDVGTGSGILALGALLLGVPRATGVDLDGQALEVAAGNARLNRLEDRIQLVAGGPDAIDGTWPLVVANVLAAPLIEMAPVLVRRLGRHSQLVLSGIPSAAQLDVVHAYGHLGMLHQRTASGGAWTALVLRTSW